MTFDKLTCEQQLSLCEEHYIITPIPGQSSQKIHEHLKIIIVHFYWTKLPKYSTISNPRVSFITFL